MQAHSDLTTYRARLLNSRQQDAEHLAMARKAIAESLELMAKADAIIAWK